MARFLIFSILMIFGCATLAQNMPPTKVLLGCQQKWETLQVSDDGLGYIRIRRTLVDAPTYVVLGPQPQPSQLQQNEAMYFRTADSKSLDAIIDGAATVNANQNQVVITTKNQTTLTLSFSRPSQGEALLTLTSTDIYLLPAVMKQLQAPGQISFDYFVGDCSVTP